MAAQLIVTRKTFSGKAPLNKIEAERSRFPIGPCICTCIILDYITYWSIINHWLTVPGIYISTFITALL